MEIRIINKLLTFLGAGTISSSILIVKCRSQNSNTNQNYLQTESSDKL